MISSKPLLVSAALSCLAIAYAQSPSPQGSAAADTTTLIDSLAPAEIDEAMRALRANFVDPSAFKDQEINRATLQGLLGRLRGGAVLLPGKAKPETVVRLFSDSIENHIGYVRVGSLVPDNLAELDKALGNFAAKKVDALIVDLRASSASNEFDIAAEIAKRFTAKGKPLWTLHKAAARQDRTFASDRDAAFQGVLVGLIDSDTSGAAEAIAAALKTNSQTLLVGQPTAGCAVEYSDFPLASGKILRVAVAEVVVGGGHSLFPFGMQPDLPVQMSLTEKRQIFALSVQRGGVGQFVFETGRPHFNEAALIAGTNPELEARQQRHGSDDNLHDAVLQRAVDVITSLAVFQKR